MIIAFWNCQALLLPVQVDMLFQKFRGYLVTGGLAAIIDLGCFTLLVHTGLPIWCAALFGFLIAALGNYLASAYFVFGRVATVALFFTFLTGAALGLIVNVGVTSIAVVCFGISALYSKILGIGTAFGFNFFINARLVFK